MQKEQVIIYGMGNFFQRNYDVLNNNYDIVAFVDRDREGTWADKQILRIEDIVDYSHQFKVIIMIESLQTCIDVAHTLQTEMGFSWNHIILGIGMETCGMLRDGIEEIKYTSEGDVFIKIKGFSCRISSQNEFDIVKEVLVDEIYHYYINNKKKDIVIDVGMNIGDATYYFLKMPKVKKVYAYEPFKMTYTKAINNLSAGGRWQIENERLECFQYGLSDKTETRIIRYNSKMSYGMSTLENVTDYAIQNYERCGLVKHEDSISECIEVRRASDELRLIMKKHKNENLILKMDCEGEEYGIFEDLEREGLLEKIDFIMLEWHYRGRESILKKLKKAGFSYWCIGAPSQMGLIYAYNKNTFSGEQ